MDKNKMLLDDALNEAINQTRDNIKLKKALILSLTVNFVFLVAIVSLIG